MSKTPSKLARAIFSPSPRGRVRWVFVVIVALAVIAGLVDYPAWYNRAAQAANERAERVILPEFPDIPFHLGLDLQGGTHLVYEADLSEIDPQDHAEAVEGVRDVIERRVNALGVSEPLVQSVKSGDSWRIIVELAGIKDVSQAIAEIGETPLLEFKEPDPDPEPVTAEPVDAESPESEANEQAKRTAADLISRLSTGNASFEALVAEFSQDPEEITQAGGSLGFVSASGEYGYLHAEAERLGVGKVSDRPVDRPDSYQVIRVNDSRQTDTEILASHILICYEGASRCDGGLSKEEALARIQDIASGTTPENFAEKAAVHSTEPGAETSGGDLGWFGPGVMVPPFEQAAKDLAVGAISEPVETEFGYHLIHKRDQRPITEYDVSRILLAKPDPTEDAASLEVSADPWLNTDLSGKHLKRAQLSFDPNTSEPLVSIEFDDQGKELFADLTSRLVGQPMAIFLDGQLLSAPTVQAEIRGGEAVITGGFTVEEAKLLAQRLNAGALPVPIELVSQQTVGATLGAESVQRSLMAGIIGLILVALYMLLVYRLPGLLSVLALALYTGLVIALFKLALPGAAAFLVTLVFLGAAEYFVFKNEKSDFEKIVFGIIALLVSIFIFTLLANHVTLTLAGVAGLLLSIGMAVDANVLIFERMKEELRNGKPLQSAIDDGFIRAWGSIRDGNISTLITSFILATFSTSIIKGFAITLSAGIILSMFTAIVVTKNFLKLVAAWPVGRVPWLFGGKRNNV